MRYLKYQKGSILNTYNLKFWMLILAFKMYKWCSVLIKWTPGCENATLTWGKVLNIYFNSSSSHVIYKNMWISCNVTPFSHVFIQHPWIWHLFAMPNFTISPNCYLTFPIFFIILKFCIFKIYLKEEKMFYTVPEQK